MRPPCEGVATEPCVIAPPYPSLHLASSQPTARPPACRPTPPKWTPALSCCCNSLLTCTDFSLIACRNSLPSALSFSSRSSLSLRRRATLALLRSSSAAVLSRTLSASGSPGSLGAGARRGSEMWLLLEMCHKNSVITPRKKCDMFQRNRAEGGGGRRFVG